MRAESRDASKCFADSDHVLSRELRSLEKRSRPNQIALETTCTPPGDVGYIPDIYQVRGFDLSDISFVKGRTGWIVFDPLISAETARAAVRVEKFWLRVHEKVWGA